MDSNHCNMEVIDMLFLDVLKIVLAIFLGIKIEQIRELSKEMKRDHDIDL